MVGLSRVEQIGESRSQMVGVEAGVGRTKRRGRTERGTEVKSRDMKYNSRENK